MLAEDIDYIPPTARLFWMAHHFRIAATYIDRYELECLDGYENGRTLPRAKVRSLQHTGDLVVEPFYFDIDGQPAKSGAHVDLLGTYPGSVQLYVMREFTKASMFQRAYKAGKTTLYETQSPPKSARRRRHTGKVTADVWLKQNEAAIHAACRRFYILDPTAPQGHHKPRLGQFPYPSLGSVSTLKKHRALLARKGFRITDLCPAKDRMRLGGRKMHPDMAAFLEKTIRTYLLRPERPTIAALRRFAAAQLRMIPAMAQRRVPCAPAIRGLIAKLDDAKVLMALFGEKVMTESRTIYTEGLRYTFPGELISMDCYKLDLVARLTDQGGWMFVPDEELENEWGVRRRLWVAFAVDVCSRAILGLALGLSENTDLTRQALRMVVTDKTLACRDAGCTGEPLPPIGISGLLTDIGTAFKHPHFEVSALSLVPDTDIGPGDNAHLHGIQERVNRTIKDDLLRGFTGFTFGNVVAKGGYDAMARASLDVKTIGRMLWGWVNDVYNRSAHAGLQEQTPYDRFHETLDVEGAADPCSPERLRLALGLGFDVQVTRQGMCFASNQYVSGRLQDFFKHGPKNGRDPRRRNLPLVVRMMIDPCDLGRASAFFDGEWHTLEGPARMRGIGLTDWQETRRAIRARHRKQAAVHADVVAKMLLRIHNAGEEARLRSQVRDMSYDSEEVAAAVNKIKLRIKETETASESGAILAFDSASLEASFPASGVDDTADEFDDPADIVAVADPHGDEGETTRVETDFGLDNIDIDQDGDPLDEEEDEIDQVQPDEIDPVDEGEDHSPPENETPPKRKRGRPPAVSKPFAFLPKPKPRSDS